MSDSFKYSGLVGSVLLATCLTLTSCSKKQEKALPLLPKLPASPGQQGPFLLAEASKRLKKMHGSATLASWRRLAWIHAKKGDSRAALEALDHAVDALNAEGLAPSQETSERSNLADMYVLLGDMARAKKALGSFRYQGTAPKGLAQLKRDTLTPLEEKRLEASDVLQTPQLLLTLAYQGGVKQALWSGLKSRIEFAITRGPTGARQEHFHNAVLLLFHLSNPQAALQACLRQSDPNQIRTLACLLWGGTLRPSAILYQGDGSPDWAAPPALQPLIRTQLIAVLKRTRTSQLTDLEMSAGAGQAALTGDFALAECFARQLQSTRNRERALAALAQRQAPLLSYETTGDERFGRHSILSQNLGQLAGVRNPLYQQRLLEQFIGQMGNDEDSRLFAPVISTFLWRYQRRDLLAKLETVHTNPAFLVRQALLRVENDLVRGKNVEARLELESITNNLKTIPKPSHRFQEGLIAQELARRLNDKALMEKLRGLLLTILPTIQITTMKNDGLIRLAGLNYLCGQHETYAAFTKEVTEEIQFKQHELFWKLDLLGRLAQEQARLGEFAAAMECLDQIPNELSQVSGMLMIAEEIFKTPAMPNFPVTPSLQAGPARGPGFRI